MAAQRAGRRLVGIDLGIASSHTVRVLAADGAELCRRRCEPTVASLARVEAAALAGAAAGTRLEVVLEPTGPAWLPVAVFFAGRGHTVFRVSSQKSADLRRFLSRHAKTNGIDAETLARLPLVDPRGLAPLELPGAAHAALDRRVRAAARLTEAARRKTRIKDLARQLLPMSPLAGELGKADLAVLERWADPRALLAAGQPALAAVIAEASRNRLGPARAGQWLGAAAAAVELYGEHPAMPHADLAAEIAAEIRLLRATEAERDAHAAEREACYRWADLGQLARTLPGVAEVGAPALVAAVGRPGRFRNGAAFRRHTGLTPAPPRPASPTAKASR
jgi:transposase